MIGNRGEIKFNETEVENLQIAGDISGIGVASFDASMREPTGFLSNGVDRIAKTKLAPESIFRAASLTKAMFAYLVLKLIIANRPIFDEAKPGLGKFELPEGLGEFNLNTPLCKIIPDLANRFPPEDKEKAEALTAQHVLSHETGLPINERDGQTLKFKFKPGTEYGYSNPGILLLQEVIEKLTKSDLQTLAQENVFDHLKMRHSHFYALTRILRAAKVPLEKDMKSDTLVMVEKENELIAYRLNEKRELISCSLPLSSVQDIYSKLPKVGEFSDNVDLMKAVVSEYYPNPPMNACNSLHTTPSDYARLMAGWLREMELRGNEILKDAFKKPAKIKYDKWADEQGITEEDRKKVAWGTGIGLQLNDQGKEIRAFHTGDMDEWRACVAIDLETKKGIVYFANSKNGNILTDLIINPNVKLQAALNNFFQKFGFARYVCRRFVWLHKLTANTL